MFVEIDKNGNVEFRDVEIDKIQNSDIRDFTKSLKLKTLNRISSRNR